MIISKVNIQFDKSKKRKSTYYSSNLYFSFCKLIDFINHETVGASFELWARKKEFEKSKYLKELRKSVLKRKNNVPFIKR